MLNRPPHIQPSLGRSLSRETAFCFCLKSEPLAWTGRLNQWIGLRENLQDFPIFNGKIYGFRLRFSLKPIHWLKHLKSLKMTSLVDAISTYIYPPWKMMEFVRLDHHPNILGKIKAMFQSAPTRSGRSALFSVLWRVTWTIWMTSAWL